MTSTLTLREAFETVYLRHSTDLSPRTIQRYRHVWNQWERHTDDPPISEITTETFVEFRQSRNGSASTRTIEDTISDALAILRCCHRVGKLDSVPDAGKRLRHKRTDIPPQPTADELGRMYSCCYVANWPRKSHVSREVLFRTFIVFAYCTAMRLSDMLAVRWSDIRGDEIQFRARKTSKLQVVPIHSCLHWHLEKLRGPGEILFPVTSPTRLRRTLKRIAKVAAVKVNVTPQSLRRASATAWETARDGAGRLILGHSLPGASPAYISVPAILKRAVEDIQLPEEFVSRMPEQQRASLKVLKSRRRRKPIQPPGSIKREEWQFQPGYFAFRGEWHPLTGAAHRLLVAFVEANAPMTTNDLEPVVYATAKRRRADLVRNRIKVAIWELRAALRESLRLQPEVDPVPCAARNVRGVASAWMLNVHVPKQATGTVDEEMFYSEVVA